MRLPPQRRKTLPRALEFAAHGWPDSIDHDKPLEPYFHRKHELSVEDNCLLWGRRVVIPADFETTYLKSGADPGVRPPLNPHL